MMNAFHRGKAYLLAGLVAGIIIGTTATGPASAHVGGTVTHLWSLHIKPLAKKLFYTKAQIDSKLSMYAKKSSLSTAGTLNSSTNPLHWTRLKGVPAGLADGIDANSGGDITSVAAGPGLTGGGANGALTMRVDFGTGAGKVAAGSASYLKADTYSSASVDAAFDRSICKFALANPYSIPAPWCSFSSAVDSGGDVGWHTSVAIGADGLPIVSYFDLSNSDLKVAHCGNAACSFGNTVTSVDTAGVVGWYTSIAIGADGLPVISYRDDGSGGYLKFLHCGNAACSSGNVITGLSGAGMGYDSSIAIGSDGFPVVSYRDVANGDLKVSHCVSVNCTSLGNTAVTVDAAGSVGYYTSLAIGTDGFPVISYYDDTNDDLKVAHCTDVSCSSSTTAAVDTTGNIGSHTSIAIGADGLPVVSYYDQTNGDLKVAHCGNLTCSSGNTITTVDADGDVGWQSSVAIGVDGLPVVSYFRFTSGDLKVLHCGNASCSSGNRTASVDTAGNVGSYPSIAIGADGMPVVSYYDFTKADLKVAHLPE